MQQATPLPTRIMVLMSTASGIAMVASLRTAERLFGEPPFAVSVLAILAGAVVAAALVFVVARILLGPDLSANQPVRPLSRAAWVDLLVGFPLLLACAILSRVWLGVDVQLSLALLYVPAAFVWLRREIARQASAAGGT